MPTTRKVSPHFQTISGVDTTTPPHLVPDNKWTNSLGFRSYYGKLQQFGLFKLEQAGFNPNPPIHKIIPIPTGFGTQVHPVLITGNGVWRVSYTNPPERLGDTLDDGFGNPAANGVDRMAAVLYNNTVWYGSPLTAIRYTDGTSVGTYATETPRARYLEFFFDHLVAANYTYKGVKAPWAFRFSDLYNPGSWEPSPENESDFYDVVSWQRDHSVVAGITGLGKIGDRLFAYTDSCIVPITYVGLPKVFQVGQPLIDYGNAFLNGLVVAKDAHFFFDGYHQNFFMFDGSNRPQPIGDPILGFFLSKINLNYLSTDRTQELTGFTVPERNEAWWCFFSSDGVSAYALVYNWRANEWTVNELPSVFRFLTGAGGGGTIAKTVAELGATPVSALTGRVENLAVTDIKFARQFTTQTATRYREEISSDATAGLIGPPTLPTLETKDYFDDLQRVVEVDRFCIHADYVASAGIKVYVSARDSLQQPVVYKEVGTWTKETRQGLVTFKPIPGRIFRYKFEFQIPAVGQRPRGCVFYAFTDNIFNLKAEQ